MASIGVGAQVFFNESTDENPSWCVGIVVQTDTVPSAESINAIEEDPAYGGYATAPDAGNVSIVYWAMLDNASPVPTSINNVAPGTGPQQWAAALPEGW